MTAHALPIASVSVKSADVVIKVKPFTAYCPSDVQPILHHKANDHERLEHFRSTVIQWIREIDDPVVSTIDKYSSDSDVITRLHSKLSETCPWLTLPPMPPYMDYYEYD